MNDQKKEITVKDAADQCLLAALKYRDYSPIWHFHECCKYLRKMRFWQALHEKLKSSLAEGTLKEIDTFLSLHASPKQ